MRRSFVVATVLALALLAVNGPAGAGNGPVGLMQVDPAAPTTADEVVISNQDGDSNTCTNGAVYLFVEQLDGPVVFDDLVVGDQGGEWSQSLGMLPAGDYLAEADCDFGESEDQAVGPAADPFFAYVDLEFTVTQVGTLPTDSVPSTTTTAAPTTTAAAGATATPRFTG
jgi:hypothetical protein